jgi:mRNA-degrading endonuclease RelE of RelBE toxin-antitoxin system
MTIVETPGFLRDAAAALTEKERTELVSFLAANPEAGDVMPETGGARKLRWRAQGRGKSGGTRVIYYYHDTSLPLFMLNVFKKNEKANLSRAGRNEMKALVPRLITGYRKRITK